jgi:hypothetical protein
MVHVGRAGFDAFNRTVSINTERGVRVSGGRVSSLDCSAIDVAPGLTGRQ